MSDHDQYIKAMMELADDHERRLLEHGAIDSIAGDNFYAYVIEEPGGRLSADVWCWGVNYGKVAFADTLDDLKAMLYAVYDPSPEAGE